MVELFATRTLIVGDISSLEVDVGATAVTMETDEFVLVSFMIHFFSLPICILPMDLDQGIIKTLGELGLILLGPMLF